MPVNAMIVLYWLFSEKSTKYFQFLPRSTGEKQKAIAYSLHILRPMICGIFLLLSERLLRPTSVRGGISAVTSSVCAVFVNHEIVHWYQLAGALLILVDAGGANCISVKKSERWGRAFGKTVLLLASNTDKLWKLSINRTIVLSPPKGRKPSCIHTEP